MYKQFYIGSKNDVLGTIDLLNRLDKGICKYHFRSMREKQGLFLIVYETDEFEDYGVVSVRDNKVYAVSEDVYHFVYRIFEKVLE